MWGASLGRNHCRILLERLSRWLVHSQLGQALCMVFLAPALEFILHARPRMVWIQQQCVDDQPPSLLKLKLVHLHGYSSAFLHARTRTAFPSACTLVPVGHTVRPGLVWFNTYLPVYLSTPYTCDLPLFRQG